jgi:uncharacterized protein YfaS (alpha-2-macroglobulin family)
MGPTCRRFIAVLTLFLSLYLGAPSPAQAQESQKELGILRVTPEGTDVSSTRQIVIEFNRPVVPIGTMDRQEADLGISISPALQCQWRWLNTTSLSCNLGDETSLSYATTYKLSIAPKIVAEDGAMIKDVYEHSFTTALPSAQSAYMREWKSPVLPRMRVSFNQPVTKQSAQDHIYFETTGGQSQRIAVKAEAGSDDESDVAHVNSDEASYVWDIEPVSDLPSAAHILLKEEAGLISAEGPELSTETRDIRSVYTFPEFALAAIVCLDKDNKEVRISNDKPQTDETLCNPLQPVRVAFTSPVMRSAFKDHFKFTPDLAGGRKDFNPWGGEVRDWSQRGDDRSFQDREYTITLPIGLKAAQEYTVSVEGKKPNLWQRILAFFTGKKDTGSASMLADEFGRTLAPFQLSFKTGHRNPNFEMVYRDAVLEKGIDSEIPFYVNNLTGYSFNYNYLTTDMTAAQKNTTGPVSVSNIQDIQYAVPFGVRDMLKGKSGALYGHVDTTPNVSKWDGAGRLFVQVTPYQVYVKLGHYQSSVWVTDLATGKTVEDAKVTIFRGQLANLSAPDNSDEIATADTDETGIALLPGTDVLDPTLTYSRAYKDTDTRLFVRVEKGEDMALLPIAYDYEVQLWNVADDVWTNPNQKFGHMKAWGMTAQGIYRAGDTMQYKIYVRDQDNNRLIAPPSGKYALEITDPMGKSVQKIDDVKVTEFGTIHGEYAIPKNSSVGFYSFKLEATLQLDGKAEKKEFYPLSVLVSDFTPAPFRVTTELNGDQFKPGDTLEIMSDAKLHSGGAYGDAAIRSTITLRSRPFISKNPAAQGFQFDSFQDEAYVQSLEQKEGKLDDKGEWKNTFTLPEREIVFGQLVVEGAVRDDRGKSIASEARADYVGVDRLVGLKPADWVFTAGKPSTVRAIVVDDKGVATEGSKIEIAIEKEKVLTAKVKSAGNAYTNDNTVEWEKVTSCALKSSKESVNCEFKPETAGSYRAVATIADTKGRTHKTTSWLWVSGTDYVQWNEGKEYALTLLPEKTDYKVGDTARFLLKNPYPGAAAYISVERYGVLDNFVKILDSSTPIIEIPVKADYIPGFYLSVVVVSPRVDAPPPELGQVDMGKPAFRVGYVKMPVSDFYKEMIVNAKADAEIYRPRDKVRVSLEAKAKHESENAQPIELAVAVLDESVFDLISEGRDAFDPYKGFYDLETLDVANYSLLTRLVGRQKFEKKGANAGGDGGDAEMRNLFKFVSYWNPSVPVDKNGNAHIEFEAPDNLTGWRILAVANTKDDLMGLGEATFKVNRPTEIRPVMPNQVREGDKFSAGFSVMNRTDKTRTINVSIEATGNLDKDSKATFEQSVTLDPYKRTTIFMPVKAALLPITSDKPEGILSFSATAGDGTDKDGLDHTIPVLKSRTIDTAATYGTTTNDTASENIEIPKDIYTDTGAINVVLSPSVIATLDGAFRYMRDYSYPCWEQKLSVATMASQYKKLTPYLSVEWDGVETITADILASASEYQSPNGGMAYFKAGDDYADPYLSAYTALVFRWLKADGHAIPAQVEEKLHAFLLNFLKNNTAPNYYQAAMTSTVRAVILDALSDSGKITSQDIIRFKPHVKGMSLFGKTHYLQAAQRFPDMKDASRETFGMILSSGIESGGKFIFNENYDDGFNRILATPIRDNCAILDMMMDYPDDELIGDKPFKLVRTITAARGNRDHWENTQENLFCMKALADYAKKYESEEPRMRVSTSLNAQSLGNAEFTNVKGKPQTLSKPLDGVEPGTKSVLSINREGTGRLYYGAQLRYALKNPVNDVNAGMEIRREYSVQKDNKWQVAKDSLNITRGDLVRVDLYLSLPSARSFVVVNDPLPGGLETVNRDLATSSKVDAEQAQYDQAGGSFWFKHSDWREYNASRWSFYHRELRHDSARFYADWLEPGNYHLSYTAQAVATGTFAIPATLAEEMYDPDIYGRGAKGELKVEESR